jgi:hypothetical protein
MNKRKIFTCLGLAAAFTAFVVVRKRNKAEGKIRRAVFVFRNELPLKLEFIQDDLSRLQVLKKVRVQDKDGLRNVLALKYEWIKKFAFDIQNFSITEPTRLCSNSKPLKLSKL